MVKYWVFFMKGLSLSLFLLFSSWSFPCARSSFPHAPFVLASACLKRKKWHLFHTLRLANCCNHSWILLIYRREKSLEAYQAQTTCVVRMQHEIKTLRAVVSLFCFCFVKDRKKSGCIIFWSHMNPLTPMSDQDRKFPYNINTRSSRQVMKIKKNVN